MKRLFAPPRELFSALRPTYLPLFLGYFAHSFSGMFGMGAGITTVPASFWIQENLSISPAALAFMSFTISLPWISKVLIGQLVDGWSIIRRKRALLYSGALMLFGFWMLASLAGEYDWIMSARWFFGSNEDALVRFQTFFLTLGYLLVSAAMCLQDVILDPLSRHIVSRRGGDGNPLAEEEYRYKVGVVQVWCRISFNFASILGMVAAGFLMARGVSIEYIFLATLSVPVVSVMFIRFIRLPHDIAITSPRKDIVSLTLGLVALVIAAQMFDVPFSREISFLATLSVVIYLLRSLAKKRAVSPTAKRGMLFTAITLALIVMLPGAGKGATWWFREELGYTRQFETALGVFGGLLSLLLLFFTYKLILKGHLGWVLLGFNLILSALSSVNLFFWHGGHVWLGGLLGADPLGVVRWIAWINTAASSPFALLYGMIMFIFLAQYADDEGTATWFTVFAVFFNLSMTGGSLLTGYLNNIFVVGRGNYAELGNLMWTSWLIGLFAPVVAVILFLTPWRKNSEPLAYLFWQNIKLRIGPPIK